MNNFAKLVCLSGIALSAALVADGCEPKPKPPSCGCVNPEDKNPMYCGGFTLGSITRVSHGDATEYFAFGYIDDMFTFDVGASYLHSKVEDESTETTVKSNNGNLIADLGLRENLYQNLYATYGVEGTVTVGKVPDGRPWSVGVFVGLDLQITRHFLLSGKILPFNYDHPGDDSKFYSVFDTGTIELAYVF